MMKKIIAGVKSLFRKEQLNRELDEEMQGFIEAAAERKMLSGMSREQALREARMEIGSTTGVRDQVYASGWESVLESLWQDFRYGMRMLRKNPGFSCVAILTLALGIGANTAIFSVINGVLLHPLPYQHPEQLYSVQEKGGGWGSSTSYPNVADWRSQNHVFTGIASYHGDYFTLTGNGDPAHLWGEVVSSDLLNVLEEHPLRGRDFEAKDDEMGVHSVLLSHALWRQQFHSDEGIVGRGITLDQQSFTVIGVMPPGFTFPANSAAQLWVGMGIDPESPRRHRGNRWLNAIARLKPGVTAEQAQADMDVIAQRLARQFPENNARSTSIRLMPQLERLVGPSRLPLMILLGVVAGVLLIGCVNLANLSLARNLERQKEIAVRAALGAGRRRLVTQLLSESMLLALLGGGAGISLAAWGTPSLLSVVPKVIPRASEVGLDGRVLAFAILLSAVTALLFGLLPAYQASKTDILVPLNDARQTTSSSRGQRRFRGLLVTLESALAVVLLAGAGLLVTSYLKLLRADPGFDPHGLLTFDFDLRGSENVQEIEFYNQLLSQLQQTSGVKAAAATWPLPFSGDEPQSGIQIEGRTFPPGQAPTAPIRIVTPGYFGAVGMRLLQGRDFTEHDTLSSTQVMIVDEAFVHTYFPNENPMGKHVQASLTVKGAPPWREIVGVVNSTKEAGLAEDFRPQYYIPYPQLPGPQPSVVVKTEGDPQALAPAVRSIMNSMDKNVALYDVESMDSLATASAARERFNALLVGLFASLALTLAAIGIYGVMSYTVGQATREIGIRMALGARAADVMKLTIGGGLKNVIAGLALGLVAALALTRVMESLLYKIGANDPFTLLAVCVFFIIVATMACYIPARRATKVDPLIVLRYE